MLKKWTCPPDTERRYNDAVYYILSRIVNKVSGKTLFPFCWENIFLPLAFKEAAWSCCPKGHAIGATGLYIRVEDMTKLGAPEGFTVTVRNVKISAGAGFVVAITGAIMTMPGLPKEPLANKIDILLKETVRFGIKIQAT